MIVVRGLMAVAVAGLLIMPCAAMAAKKDDKSAEAAAPATPVSESLNDKPADYDERLALAVKIHDIQPAVKQVEGAIENLSRPMSEEDRKSFREQIMKALDIARLEDVSKDAMARTFTTPELKAMFAYFSSPEAAGITQKMPIYQQLVQPEIIRMLDKAVMDMRMGAGAAAPQQPSPVLPAP